MTETPTPAEPAEPKKTDWIKTLDLKRTTLIKNFVDRMESVMREADAARDDLKEICAEAKEAEFGPRDVAAMKKIAKLRKDDKGGRAREEIEALEKISHAVGFNLFGWADAKESGSGERRSPDGNGKNGGS